MMKLHTHLARYGTMALLLSVVATPLFAKPVHVPEKWRKVGFPSQLDDSWWSVTVNRVCNSFGKKLDEERDKRTANPIICDVIATVLSEQRLADPKVNPTFLEVSAAYASRVSENPGYKKYLTPVWKRLVHKQRSSDQKFFGCVALKNALVEDDDVLESVLMCLKDRDSDVRDMAQSYLRAIGYAVPDLSDVFALPRPVEIPLEGSEEEGWRVSRKKLLGLKHEFLSLQYDAIFELSVNERFEESTPFDITYGSAGYYIEEITPGGNMDKLGFRVDDFIWRINDEWAVVVVPELKTLNSVIKLLKRLDKVEVLVRRWDGTGVVSHTITVMIVD